MTIAKLNSVEISYLDEGEGEAFLLVHGFGSTKEVNWVNTGWVKLLVASGYRVIIMDNRGHGESQKFHALEDYSLAKMANDCANLLDYLNINKCHIMGYSMGARICSKLAMEQTREKAGRIDIDKVILAGNGYGMIDGAGDWAPVRDALLAPSLADVTDDRGRRFRAFADQTKSDRKALAACVMSVRELFSEAQFASLKNPVLVAIGTEDDIAGSAMRLVDLIPNAKFLPIPGRDHMRAVGDKTYMQGVLEFLKS